ncbi:MAG: hypothetical protein RO469_11290 [Thermincola sp.]|jgi:hypothetical protein|nr:hypothetical protein [Thermincola sp.]MDT3701586.1 hypothetical protein [Thermincola sp.]
MADSRKRPTVPLIIQGRVYGGTYTMHTIILYFVEMAIRYSENSNA